MKPERSPESGTGFWLGSILLVFVGASFLAAAPAPGRSLKQTQLTRFEHQVTPDRIRVVVRFDAAVQYVGGTATDPFRIYFDLQGTRPAAALGSRAEVGDSIVQRIRVAQYRPGITRMVLDMARPAPYTATFLPDPPRLVIEVLRAGAGTELRNVREGHNPNPLPSALASAPPRRDSHHTPAGRQAGLQASTPDPPPPTQALIPEQMPPLQPQVTYRNGLLTIVASNSTLSDVLHAVAVHTGATVDAPASLIGQRVAARLGPAPPREVMADLLAGFDYIVVGASNDPYAIRNIILSPNSSSVLIPAQSGRPAPQEQVKTESPEEGAEPAEPEPSPQPAAQEPEPAAGTRGQAAPVKTPEELLEELRKLQDEQSKEPGR